MGPCPFSPPPKTPMGVENSSTAAVPQAPMQRPCWQDAVCRGGPARALCLYQMGLAQDVMRHTMYIQGPAASLQLLSSVWATAEAA